MKTTAERVKERQQAGRRLRESAEKDSPKPARDAPQAPETDCQHEFGLVGLGTVFRCRKCREWE